MCDLHRSDKTDWLDFRLDGMAGRRVARKRKANGPQHLVPRIELWLESDGRYAFGPGLSEILLAVHRAGSIKQAASAVGKSYRFIWGRIKEAEQVLGQQLVETKVGGKDTQRSSLTPHARQLVNAFLAFRGDIIRAVEQDFRRRCSAFVPS
jgi:molybdate transport repressor ModE-like protein